MSWTFERGRVGPRPEQDPRQLVNVNPVIQVLPNHTCRIRGQPNQVGDVVQLYEINIQAPLIACYLAIYWLTLSYETGLCAPSSSASCVQEIFPELSTSFPTQIMVGPTVLYLDPKRMQSKIFWGLVRALAQYVVYTNFGAEA